MSVIQASRFYIDKIVGDSSISGMKVLLLDAETTQGVAMVYSQSQVLERDVFLVERLEKARTHEPMPHLKAAVFVRPTRENLELLKAEVAEPRFAEYHLFFSNVVPSYFLQQLADADTHEIIRQVQEFYADFMAINDDLFTINQRNAIRLSNSFDDNEMFLRNVQGVLSVLLALKKQPSQIRYQGSSSLARQTANEIHTRIQADGIFHFSRGEGPVLLILDRRDDPVTPLLSQWTYQAMVHQLLGLHGNRVSLKGRPNVVKDNEEVVLSCTQDGFFAKHQYANFGDLGAAIKGLLDDYQKQVQLNEKITSIEDMQNFIKRFPAFKSQSINVSKHVAIMTELSRLVDTCSLMDVAQLEQELACNDEHSSQFRDLMEMLSNPRVKPADKLRSGLLYALRYEGNGNVEAVKSRMIDGGVAPEQAQLVDLLLKYGGQNKRGPGLYGERGLAARMAKGLKSLAIDGVENVYSQHVPLLMRTLDAIRQGKLSEKDYPVISGGSAAGRPQVVVYIVGGVTFEEAVKVAELNASSAGMQVVLGGSFVHNTESFLEDLRSGQGSAPACARTRFFPSRPLCSRPLRARASTSASAGPLS